MHVSPDHLLVAGTVGPRQPSRDIWDREKVLTILQKRFPGSTPDQLAAATNALMGLKTEWREVADFDSAEGRRFKVFEHLHD